MAPLKTTQVKLALGVVGVAGVSTVIAVKSLGKGKTADLSIPADTSNYKYSPSERKLKSRFEEDTKEWDTDLFASDASSTLNMKIFNCATSFFPGVAWPSELKSISNSSSTNNPDLVSAPTNSSPSTTQACLSMHLKRKSNNQTLFRSEFTIKNQNIGIAFWTVFKNYSSSTSLDNYPNFWLFFLEKDTTQSTETWSVKMGFTWGGSPETTTDKTITIQSPEASHTFNKQLVSNNSTEVDESYSGIWTEGGTEKPISLQEGELKFENETTFTPNTLHQTIDIQKLGFCKESCLSSSGCFLWKTVQGDTTTQHKTAISKTISDWHAPFQNKQGKWQTLSSYCQSRTRNDLNDDKSSRDPCFMPNAKQPESSPSA